MLFSAELVKIVLSGSNRSFANTSSPSGLKPLLKKKKKLKLHPAATHRSLAVERFRLKIKPLKWRIVTESVA